MRAWGLVFALIGSSGCQALTSSWFSPIPADFEVAATPEAGPGGAHDAGGVDSGILVIPGDAGALPVDAAPPMWDAGALDARARDAEPPSQDAGCDPSIPTVEVCDGIDNDCDGNVDGQHVCERSQRRFLVDTRCTVNESYTEDLDVCLRFNGALNRAGEVPQEVFSSIGEDTPFSDSQALNFSGIANAAIVVPVRPEAFGQTFTLALRIKPTTVGVASSYAMIYQGSGFYIRLNHDGTGWRPMLMMTAGDASLYPEVYLSPNQWHHLMVTYDRNLSADQLHMMVDGQVVDSRDYDQTLVARAAGFHDLIAGTRTGRPGNWTYSQSFQGLVDDVRGWSRLLGHQELGMLGGRLVERYEPATLAFEHALKWILFPGRGLRRPTQLTSQGRAFAEFLDPVYKPFFPFAQHVRTFTVSLRRGVDHLDQPFRVVLGSYDQGGSLVMDNGGTNRRLRVGIARNSREEVDFGEDTPCEPDASGDYGAVTWSFDWGAVTQDGVRSMNGSSFTCDAGSVETGYPATLGDGLDYMMVDPGAEPLRIESIEWDLRNNP